MNAQPTRTELPAVLTNPFPARYAGICLITGRSFEAGTEIRLTTEKKALTAAALRAWRFVLDGEIMHSPFRPCSPAFGAPLRVEAYECATAFEAGRTVATVNRAGEIAYWKTGCRGIERTLNGSRSSRVFKSSDAWFRAIGSKADGINLNAL